MSVRTLACLLALGFTLSASMGCKSDVEKACENIAKIYEEDEGFDTEEGGECARDLQKSTEKCANYDEVMQCAIDATDKEALMGCWLTTCKAKED